MSDPRKRRWFQFHLATAIVLILVIGAILGLNLNSLDGASTIGSQSEDVTFERARELREQEREVRGGNPNLHFLRSHLFGWPLRFCYYGEVVTAEETGWRRDDEYSQDNKLVFLTYYLARNSGVLSFIVDVVIWIALVLSVSVIGETVLRRREARKP